MKKLLTTLSMLTIASGTSTSVLACSSNSANLFFSDSEKIGTAISEIKAIDHTQITTLRDLDVEIEAILERAILNLDSNRIIPGTISVQNFYWFYADSSASRRIIADIDSDNDGISDFIGSNYIIKVDYQERDGFGRDIEDDIIYIYNTQINKNHPSFLTQFQNTVRRPIRVEYERNYSQTKIYSEVIEELSEKLTLAITSNIDRTGFSGGFLNGIDIVLDIPGVTNGRSISNGTTYQATINTGAALELDELLSFEITFIRD